MLGGFMVKHSSLLVILFLLSSCGGSSDTSSPQPSVEPPPPPSSTPTQTVGVITGFGSVFINGIKYQTSATNISTDDNSNAVETDLQVGMVVSLNGSINNDGKTGNASSIHYEEQIKGPLTSIDLAANTLIILGQTIIFDELTSLDNVVLENLIPGDFLEVSGFLNSDNQLYATRIELENNTDDSQLKIQGIIAMLNSETKTFSLGDISIDYSTAVFEGNNFNDLADGELVRVKGVAFALVDNIFTISHIKIISTNDQHDDGDKRHLEGIITSFTSSENFIVNGLQIMTTSDTRYEYGTIDSLSLNVRVKIKGTYDDQGRIVANEIRIHQRTQLKLEGLVQVIDLDSNTITVLDVVFEVSAQTKMKDESDVGERFFDITDLVIGDFVEIKGFVNNNSQNIATKLKRENVDFDKAIELKGLVTEITDFTFVIIGISVHTSETTKFEGVHGEDIDQVGFFEQLEEGMFIETKGHVIDDVFTAKKIEIKHSTDSDDNERTEFRGIIDVVLPDTLVVSGHLVEFTLESDFEFNDENITAEQFWQWIKIGDQIKVKGVINDEGTITAQSIELEVKHQQGVAKISLWGVPSYADNTLSVESHTVEFTEKTKFKGEHGNISFIEFIDLILQWPGIEVKGILRNDVIFADKITLTDNGDEFGNIKLESFIEATIDNGVVIAGHSAIYTDETTFKIDDEVDMTEFVSQVDDNSEVELKGELIISTNSDGTINETILIKEIEIE